MWSQNVIPLSRVILNHLLLTLRAVLSRQDRTAPFKARVARRPKWDILYIWLNVVPKCHSVQPRHFESPAWDTSSGFVTTGPHGTVQTAGSKETKMTHSVYLAKCVPKMSLRSTASFWITYYGRLEQFRHDKTARHRLRLFKQGDQNDSFCIFG